MSVSILLAPNYLYLLLKKKEGFIYDDKKAVIPVGGLGTRFLPATKAQPKEMLPIVDKPAVQYIVEEAVKSGIESIIFITGRNKNQLKTILINQLN